MLITICSTRAPLSQWIAKKNQRHARSDRETRGRRTCEKFLQLRSDHDRSVADFSSTITVPAMAPRLLPLLEEVEQVLLQASAFDSGRSWIITRAVNHAHGVGRITLVPRSAGCRFFRGSIFLQSAALPGGSRGFKVNFNWHGSDAFPLLVLDAEALTNWKNQAIRIASVWMAGPPPMATADFAPLIALAS
jgi:hypothetical protein